MVLTQVCSTKEKKNSKENSVKSRDGKGRSIIYNIYNSKKLWIFFQFLAYSQLSNSNILVVLVKCLLRKYKLLPTFKLSSLINISTKLMNFKILEVIKSDISKWNLYDKC